MSIPAALTPTPTVHSSTAVQSSTAQATPQRHTRLSHPVRPSVRAAWSWERRKAPRRWYWAMVTVICLLGAGAGYGQYTGDRELFEAQGATWEVIWAQSTLLLSMLFLPLALGGFAAQIATGEHRGRNWQRMSADHLETAMVAGKLLHTLQVAVATTVILACTNAAPGLFLGFDPARLAAYLPRLVVVALAMWAILILTTWLGVIMKSFATIMTAVLLASILGMGMSLVAPPLAALNPLTLLTLACSPRSTEALTSPVSVLTDGIICLVWAGVLALALHHAAGRRS